MCTFVILRRPGHAWPVLVAANRDEMTARPWRPPARHWPDRPDVVAGIDLEAGGTWLGMNDHGVVAGILNRPQSLGPAPDKRSRGEIVLEALDHGDAIAAAEALADLNGAAYKAFNLVVADSQDAYWLRYTGRPDGLVECVPLADGLSMLTARDVNDRASTRIALYLPRFEAASPPNPDTDDWAAWEALLASREKNPGVGEDGAMLVETDVGFGTMSGSLIALPRPGDATRKPVWRFSDQPPAPGGFRALPLADGAPPADIGAPDQK